MFLFHTNNKVSSQITKKITDESRITANWVFTDHRINKSKITDHRKNNSSNHESQKYASPPPPLFVGSS